MILELMRSDILTKAHSVYGFVSTRTILKTCLTDGTFAMFVYRLMQASRRHRWSMPLAMVFNKINVWFGGCVIGRGADFGPGFVLVHSDGVVINSAVRGGRNIRLQHRVTIGAEKGGVPTLGDDVQVGAGAVIIGGITIGSRTRIGANAVVTNDVPDDATAVGNPARIIGRNPPP